MSTHHETDNIAWIADELEYLREAGLYTNIRTIDSPMGARVQIDGRKVLNFCANNYLGLANHPRMREAANRPSTSYGIGPGAVRTIAGTMTCTTSWRRSWPASSAPRPALPSRAALPPTSAPSLHWWARRCHLQRRAEPRQHHRRLPPEPRRSRRYEHNDVADLRRQIEGTTDYNRRLIITDGVFSMDGDIAPLIEIAEVAEEYGVMLMVDDAHGEGVLGEGGRGIVDHFGLHGRVDIEVGTLSKAFGVVGGMVAGKKLIVDWLRQRGRPFLFSSAMTVPDVAACIEAVDILSESTELVDKLWMNAELIPARYGGDGL
jgi:glycine C-acetyltransferase